jgi:hypothetical protein
LNQNRKTAYVTLRYASDLPRELDLLVEAGEGELQLFPHAEIVLHVQPPRERGRGGRRPDRAQRPGYMDRLMMENESPNG